MKERLIHWVSQSSDKKIGKVPASYSPKSSCPDSCSLKEGGCYAWGLFYLRKLSRDIEGGIRRKSLEVALEKLHKTAKIVRHRVAGDCVGDQEETVEECKLIESKGLINIGYTHDWRSKETQILKPYFRASCQTEDEVLEARKNGWGTTLIVNEHTPNKIKLSNGETAIMCPVVREERRIEKTLDSLNFSSKKERSEMKSQLKKEIKTDCNSCTLCKINDKTKAITVMFEVHGSADTLNKAKGKVYEDRV
jgi:hypothetical protein